MLTMTDLCSGVPEQHVFLHTPSCHEWDWIRMAWISQGCPPVHPPPPHRGRAEEWWQSNAAVFWRCFCVLQEQRGSAFSHLQVQADVREDGHHLSPGGLILLVPAGWRKAGCSPEHKDCLVGSGTWAWSNYGVLPPSLRNLYILLSFPFLFVLALPWCCLLQSLPNSVALFLTCSNSWERLSRKGNKLADLHMVWDFRKSHVPWVETVVNLGLGDSPFSWC